MEVKVLRLDRSFPAGPIGESLGPHTSLDSLLELVDETTRLGMQKFRFLDDARRCLLGRLLVRSVLSERCKVAHRTLEFYKTASGRPYAVQHSLPYFPIDFNVTHDTNLIAVATLLRDDSLEGRRVGIDLMSVRNPWEGTTVDEFLQGIATQLTAKEHAKLESLPTDKGRLQHALALWTLKEAYVKATGEGLHCDLSQVEFDLDLSERKNGVVGSSSLEGDRFDRWIFDLLWLQEAGEEYLMAVARNEIAGGKGEVRFWRTQPDWLKFVEFGEIVDRLCNGGQPRLSISTMAPCSLCPPEQPRRAILRRPKTLQPVCKECFFEVFETEVHHTIMGYGQAEQSHKKRKGKAVAREGASEPEEEEEQEVPKKVLFKRGERVAIGASGGKDSTVLAYIMTLLNERYDYGLDLCLLSIDEGISGYRDASLDTVKRNAEQYGLPLKILSYSELYQGWTMDKVVAEVGKKGNCTYCGVFRRQALDRGAHILTVDHIVTGHNADDVAETVLMNVLRGDISRLERCTAITTGGDVDPSPTNDPSSSDPSDLESLLPRTIKRSKPFKYAYEKEIVMYAYFKKLDYHSTECIYAPTAYRGYARALVKDLEAIRPSAIVDLIYSGEAMAASLNLRGRRAGGDPDPNEVANAPPKKGITKATKKGAKQVQQKCQRCQSLSSQPLCQACMLLESLNKGVAKIDVGA